MIFIHTCLNRVYIHKALDGRVAADLRNRLDGCYTAGDLLKSHIVLEKVNLAHHHLLPF